MYFESKSPDSDQNGTSRYRYRYRCQWDDEAVLDEDVVQTASSPMQTPITNGVSNQSTVNDSRRRTENEDCKCLDSNEKDDEEEEVPVTCVRLRPQKGARNSLSVTLKVPRRSPIMEEKSDDCRSDGTISRTQGDGDENAVARTPSPNPSITSSNFYLRKSSTVIELQSTGGQENEEEEVDSTLSNNGVGASGSDRTQDESPSGSGNAADDDEDDSSSVSFSFRPPPRQVLPDSPLATEVRLRLPSQKSKKLRTSGSDSSAEQAVNVESCQEATVDDNSDFIGKYKDIDEMLGNLFRMIEDTNQTLDEEYAGFQEVHASAVKVHDNKALVAKVR